jgi:hypothetical protein
VALDWSVLITAGIPWQGNEVRRGGVLYVATEGGSGIRKRGTTRPLPSS